MAEQMLSVRGLQKTWPEGTQGLKVDGLELEEGKTAVLTGDNGAGKTTLLRVLAGLLAADIASLSWRGKNVPGLRAGKDVAYLHQQPYMLNRSVAANIKYVTKNNNGGAGQAKEALDWAGLAGKENWNATALSTGEKRRLALARIRATDAPLVLLDEPTANLDAAGTAAVVGMVRDTAAAGRTVLAAFQIDGIPEGLGHGRELRMDRGSLVDIGK